MACVNLELVHAAFTIKTHAPDSDLSGGEGEVEEEVPSRRFFFRNGQWELDKSGDVAVDAALPRQWKGQDEEFSEMAIHAALDQAFDSLIPHFAVIEIRLEGLSGDNFAHYATKFPEDTRSVMLSQDVLDFPSHLYGIPAEFFNSERFKNLYALEFRSGERDVRLELKDEDLLEATNLASLNIGKCRVTLAGLRRLLDQWREGERQIGDVKIEISKGRLSLKKALAELHGKCNARCNKDSHACLRGEEDDFSAFLDVDMRISGEAFRVSIINFFDEEEEDMLED